MNDLKFKRFLDTEIDNAKLELQKQFKTPKQLDLAASELATSIRIVYDRIVEVISVINNDYATLYLILVWQRVDLKKTMEFYLSMVNRLIAVAAAIHRVSVSPIDVTREIGLLRRQITPFQKWCATLCTSSQSKQ